MARTAFGNQAKTKQENGDGTIADITGFRNSAAIEETVDTDPDLAYGERSDGHTKGLKEGGTFNLSGSYSSGYLRHVAGIWQSATTKTAELHPAGEGSTRRFATFETIVTQLELTCELNSTSQMSTDNKVSGAIVWDAN